VIRQRLRAARANDEGFTLIELLIVVVILGVLAGIVVFAVGNFRNDGVAAACKSDVKNVEVATEAFYAKNNFTYPASVAALVTAGYLKEAPPTTEGISINTTTGAVTATGTGCP
jgi:prepilin-type N-terminal cleavage/methylation domain-containing protein